jgi:hypothetical protein
MALRRRWDRQDAANAGIDATGSAEETSSGDEQTETEASAGEDKVVNQVKRYLKGTDDSEAPSKSADLSQVGVHVASVLAAAESAAERLRTEAEEEAERMRREATKAANDLRVRATAEVEAQRTEARRQASLAGEEASKVRSEADRYAEARRHEADEESMRIVREAEDQAAALAADADERNRELSTDIAASETRMRRLAASLRDVADRLDDVAGRRNDETDAFEERDDQVLDEALVAQIGEEAP